MFLQKVSHNGKREKCCVWRSRVTRKKHKNKSNSSVYIEWVPHLEFQKSICSVTLEMWQEVHLKCSKNISGTGRLASQKVGKSMLHITFRWFRKNVSRLNSIKYTFYELLFEWSCSFITLKFVVFVWFIYEISTSGSVLAYFFLFQMCHYVAIGKLYSMAISRNVFYANCKFIWFGIAFCIEIFEKKKK